MLVIVYVAICHYVAGVNQAFKIPVIYLVFSVKMGHRKHHSFIRNKTHTVVTNKSKNA